MTGLENIIGQIKNEAEANAAERLRRAEAEVKSRIDAANAESVRMAREAEAEANRRAEAYTARMAAADSLEFSRRVLLRKQEIIREALENAKAELVNTDTGEYFEFLTALLEIYRQEPDGEIILAKPDAESMTEDFAAVLKKYGLTVSARTLDVRGGFILVYGSIEVNCTFDALFDAYGEELSDMLNSFLFGGGGE